MLVALLVIIKIMGFLLGIGILSIGICFVTGVLASILEYKGNNGMLCACKDWVEQL